MMDDVVKIETLANDLKTASADLQPFSEKLEELVENFQIEELQISLKHYLT